MMIFYTKLMRKTISGFTLVEMLITVTVIAILASIAIVSYGQWRYRTADTALRGDMTQATAALGNIRNFQNYYPPNLAGTNFSASDKNALSLYTNAPSIGFYAGLTPTQNAQLLLNVCNANLNGLYNTVCSFAGNGGGAKIHVAGTNSTNVQWPSPISQATITGTMGSNGTVYQAAANTIISQFLAQGGTFDVIVGDTKNVPLPAPNKTPNGPATAFCLEGRSSNYPGLAYHTSNSNSTLQTGTCPDDASLHYYPS